MLTLDNLAVGYSGKRGAVLSELNVEAQFGEFICLLGRNGSGKSTLLRTLSGLQAALNGAALLEGDNVAQMRATIRARQIAIVLTERAASPGLTVDDVVALGRAPHTSWAGRLSDADYAQIGLALAQAGATAFKGRLFDSLSDGERQRVMIARAIAQAPKLMVLDEITAFLDLPGRVEVMTLLRRHAKQTGTIVLLSSHDLDLSLQLADTVWLAADDGRLDVGSSAELVAKGTIGRAFDSDEVRFSQEKQRFELQSNASAAHLLEKP